MGPIARSSVVDAVAGRIRSEILNGRLPAGARLPPERELAVALGVNRLTLRAALAHVEAIGLIQTRHGAGTIVTSWRERAGLDAASMLLASLSPDDPAWLELVESILETRRIVATEAIALACSRRSEADLALLAECEREIAAADDAFAYARADLRYMRAVVRAAKNLGLELLLNAFARWPDEQPDLIRALYDERRDSAAIHGVVTQLIRAGDPEAARTLVRGALEEFDSSWSRRRRAAERKSEKKSARQAATGSLGRRGGGG